MSQLFALGRVVMTSNLRDTLQAALPETWDAEIKRMIDRHVSGDWGEVLTKDDREQNDEGLKDGNRILSAYNTSNGTKIWIITEWDRSCTTVLLPEDY